MVYPENFGEKVGFDRILERTKSLCLADPARILLDEETFTADFDTLSARLSSAGEFMMILNEEDFPLDSYPDIGRGVEKFSVSGAWLELQEVVELRKSVESVRAVLSFFNRTGSADKYPSLVSLGSDIKVFPYILDRINQVVSKNNKIKDNASRQLSQIRAEMSEKQREVAKKMQAMLRKLRDSGIAEMDVSLSLRNGRPVIPLPANQKRNISGIIHDESASGKTVFIEPSVVVEMNNEIRELEYAEKREIVAVLTNLTTDLCPYADDIALSAGYLSELDMIRAKASLGIRINAVIPEISSQPGINWEGAVHPLLFLSLEKEGKKVVPLQIKLNSEKRILLISGPNAGGKSVCLKTVGLLQYMLQMGYPVPMHRDSRAGIFSRLYIDIGDEQSIENDLSTYSSHLMNMKHFSTNADSETLVLIDEFGTGTEPMLGGAIAEAILKKINGNGCYGVITTHYSNLKHFAAAEDGIENGAMLFDSNRMLPLYKLEIGQPGSSFAFEIARNIGLPEDVILDAGSRLGEDQISFDKHLREIIRDKSYWEKKRDRIRISEKRLQETLEKYAKELDLAEKSRKEILKKAREDADALLHEANRKIENTIREIRESQADKEKTKNAREEVSRFREEMHRDDGRDDKLKEKIQKIKEKELRIREKRQRFGQLEPAVKSGIKLLDTTIQKGDFVLLKGQETPGEVIERKGNQVLVNFGNLSSRITVDKLVKIHEEDVRVSRKAEVPKSDFSDWNISERRLYFKPEMDLRGQRTEEALRNVSSLVDEAIMLGSGQLRILHGKGDGILRHMIREYLQTVDLVKDIRDEHIELGGAGVTIVNLDI